MQRIYLIIGILCCVLLASCTEIVGNQEVVIENRDLSGFKSIDILIPAEVFFKIDETFKVEIEGESNILSEISSSVRNDELSLEFKDNFNFKYLPQQKIRINISAPQLLRIDASNAATFTTNSEIREGSFTAKASGAAVINIAHLLIDKGNLTSSGASDIIVDKTTANELSIKTSGAADIEIGYAILGSLTAVQSGASNIAIKTGNAKSSILKLSGASSFDSKLFLMKKVNISCSGASEAYVCAEEELNADASGGSLILFSGTPNTDIKSSGGATVKNKSVIQETLFKSNP